jgi:N-acetylglucosamine-6-sulfatase
MKRHWRGKVTALAMAGTLGLASCTASAAERPVAAKHDAKKPNIVFVLADDLAMNLVDHMPHVQQMQRRGMTFSNYFVTDSLCCPSRSTAFTGQFPHNDGVFTNGGADGGYQGFNAHGDQNRTFATSLQSGGYRTAMMGKYLNGYEPENPVPPGWSEWDVAGNGYPEFNYSLNENGHVVRYGNQPKDYLTDVLGRKGTGFINDSVQKDQPFMMEIATFAPHGPFTPAPRDADKFPGLRAPRGPAFNEADMSDKPAWLKDHTKVRPKGVQRIDTSFRKRAQAVQALDKMIGDLEATLRATGADKDTYLVFSSDNGFHMGDHRLQMGKMTAFDTDIHVPMVVTGPDVKGGSRTDRLTQNTDLCPTFTDLGGVPVPATADGRSLVPDLTGDPGKDTRDAVLVEHHGPDMDKADPDFQKPDSGNPPSYEAIRTHDAVYVEYADGEREYYDLRSDPNELTNTVSRLSAARRASLHRTLHSLETCKAGTCRR